MKGKIQIILLSSFTSIVTSWVTFTTLNLKADADSTYVKPANPGTLSTQVTYIAWGNVSDPTKDQFITTPWDSPHCEHHYSTDMGDQDCWMKTGTYSYNQMVDPTPTHSHWVAKNYGAQCPDGQIMVGFQWGYWGNRYALIPLCRTLWLDWRKAQLPQS